MTTGTGATLADFTQTPNNSITPDDVTTSQIDERVFTDIANVEGTFIFNQEGVTDDCGRPITAVEFSFDGGMTRTSCDAEGATADK